ncbi:hypothetical protein CCHR01_16520 [Colletotrichum chrysophilum]|uniref:Secreted protein n=1 Tax=Colletotrichum chrysophilum TaxID=1836956 RepID=A0AAD9E9X6_9PEZI|nr:hypothetical protein CCHR01_16520 [Colletotrichum chrysophilum]
MGLLWFPSPGVNLCWALVGVGCQIYFCPNHTHSHLDGRMAACKPIASSTVRLESVARSLKPHHGTVERLAADHETSQDPKDPKYPFTTAPASVKTDCKRRRKNLHRHTD